MNSYAFMIALVFVLTTTVRSTPVPTYGKDSVKNTNISSGPGGFSQGGSVNYAQPSDDFVGKILDHPVLNILANNAGPASSSTSGDVSSHVAFSHGGGGKALVKPANSNTNISSGSGGNGSGGSVNGAKPALIGLLSGNAAAGAPAGSGNVL